jgi:hypothetical protein
MPVCPEGRIADEMCLVGRPAAHAPQRDQSPLEQVPRAARGAPKGLRLHAYDRFASDVRQPPGTAG